MRSKRSTISALQTYSGLKNDSKITTCVRLQKIYSRRFLGMQKSH